MNAVEKSLGPDAEVPAKAPASPHFDHAKVVGQGAGARSFEGGLLKKLLSMLGSPPLDFLLWTGERISSGVASVATIRIKDRRTLWGILRDPQLRFGDSYSDGSVDIDGDIVAVLEEISRSSIRTSSKSSLYHRIYKKLHRPSVNTLAGSRENIHTHYDIGNEFYKLWLGKTMAYTCAYYPTPDAALDTAQIAKMDHVCRKMRLRPGETVAEAGCGWGALGLHMARHYGVKVRAFNISKEQLAYARERAKAEGMTSQVEYIEDDYRNISGHYDAFVSIGMLEHVGVEHYQELGNVARRALGANGRGLIHSIGRNKPASLQPWIERRIFPGAYPPALSEMMQIFEPTDLSVLDVENIRLHYAQTLRHWMDLYEANVDRVRGLFDEKFVRMWRMYLAGSIAGFTTGTLQLFQVLFATRENNNVPWTRDHLYQR